MLSCLCPFLIISGHVLNTVFACKHPVFLVVSSKQALIVCDVLFVLVPCIINTNKWIVTVCYVYLSVSSIIKWTLFVYRLSVIVTCK